MYISNVDIFGHLWCHVGDKREYAPAQCPPQTLECFKFTCESDETEFVARGCGVSLLTTAAGLPNESCHQALEMCQRIGGTGECHTCGNKHMCNAVSSPYFLVLSLIFVLFIKVY
ncbi:hypothetical protein GCK32_007378 [Trichostrongylus colubriformis]|uniref:Uncharacterized protein n=1 Tax=Trichostrongylus colubriformis TaxID=6319 RepID=A0AAN8IZZ9_TRICO